MSALLDSVLSPEQRAAANAADILMPRRSPFDVLIAHIEAARADAASLVGQMSNASEVHAMLDEALCFAREHCFAVESSAADRAFDRREEEHMESARGFA